MRPWVLGVVALVAFSSTDAWAQTVTIVECRPRVGLTIGAATNSNDSNVNANHDGNRALEVSGTAELPIVDRWSARADVGSAQWGYQLGDGVTPDRVRVTRVTFSAVKQSPMPCGASVRLYGGVGYGAYRYNFADQPAAAWRGGAHFVGGLEVTPREHIAVAADVSLHVIGGPRRRPVNVSGLLVLQVNFGVRYVF
jgi:hypothetical protein